MPYFGQKKSSTCGPACVRMVLAYNGIERSEVELEDLCETSWLGNTCEELASGCQKLGFRAEVVENLAQDDLEGVMIIWGIRFFMKRQCFVGFRSVQPNLRLRLFITECDVFK